MKKVFLAPATYLAILFVFVFSDKAFSQDDIIMRNDDVVKAKVEEVGVNLIKYRKADNMDGPMYDMPKSDVYMIVYANGSRDVINPRQNSDATPPQQNNDVPAPVSVAPPEMPVYEQPPCPVEGYLWTPGYWGYGIGGYYWVPGVWVYPPQRGYLWTPGYWGYVGGFYGWHGGYWGEHIGFYGGVNYGYGYGGSGYYGGRWEGGAFRYNTAVSRVDVTIVHTTYVDNTVVRNNTVVSHASFNGTGGVSAQPTQAEHAAMTEPHAKLTSEQQNHLVAAKSDKSQYFSANHGTPAITAMNKPNGQHFSSEGHVANTNNAMHSTPENNNSHTMQNEQHGNQANPSHQEQPMQQHTESAQPSHNSQPASQPHSTPAQQNHPTHASPKPAPRPAPRAAPASRPQEHH